MLMAPASLEVGCHATSHSSKARVARQAEREAQQRREEKALREQMLAQLAEQDRLDQLSAAGRRTKCGLKKHLPCIAGSSQSSISWGTPHSVGTELIENTKMLGTGPSLDAALLPPEHVVAVPIRIRPDT